MSAIPSSIKTIGRRDLLVSYANDRTQSNQESHDHGSAEIGWLQRPNVRDIQYQQVALKFKPNGSVTRFSPLPAIWVLYAIGVKGPIKILCMWDKDIPRPMDLRLYLEACMVFATENQNHIPMFGSDRTLQNYWKSTILRDNPKQLGMFSTPYVPGQFWTQRGRPSVTNVQWGQSIID